VVRFSLKFENCRCCVSVAAVCIALAMMFVFCSVPTCFAVTSDEAYNNLRKAEVDLGYGFAAVAEAGNAGADIAELEAKLNDAAGLLSEGYAAFRSGDYEKAVSLSSTCSFAVDGVANEAERLQSSAELIHIDAATYTMVWSIIGLIILFVLAYVGWRILIKFYSKRVLTLRLEVEGSR
jgi:hypothetical protein